MPWEVPITVGDQTYPVQFNTEAEPTQADIDEAVSQILRNASTAPGAEEVENTGQGRFTSALANVGRGALSVIPGSIGGVGYLAEPVIGPGLKNLGESIESDIESLLPVNPAYQDEFSQKAAGAIGQAGGMLLTGGIAGTLGKGAAVARGLGAAEAAAAGTQVAGRTLLGSGFLSGSREGGQAAEQYGMEGTSAYTRALLGGAIEGATEKYLFGLGSEMAPIGRVLGLGGEAKGLGGFLARAAGTEAGEEAVAQGAGNVATKVLAPEGVETPGIGSGVGEAAALGGVAGLTFGAATGLLPSKETTKPDTEGETITVESGEMPLPEVLRNLNEKVGAAVSANADVLPATKAVLEGLQGGLTDVGEVEGDVRQGLPIRRSIASPGQEGVTDIGTTEGDVLSLVPKKSPAASPAEPTAATVGPQPTPGGVGTPTAPAPKTKGEFLASAQTLSSFTELSGQELDEGTVQSAMEKIRRDGYVEPLTFTYDPKTGLGVLSDGNHRLEAAKRLGFTQVPVLMNRQFAKYEGSGKGKATTVAEAGASISEVKNILSSGGTPPAAPPAEPTDATVGSQPTPRGVGSPPVVTDEPQATAPAIQPVSAAETPVATEPETPLPKTEKVVAPKAEPEQGAGMIATREQSYTTDERENFTKIPRGSRRDRFVISPVTGVVFDRLFSTSVTPPAFSKTEEAVKALNDSAYNDSIPVPVGLGQREDGAAIFNSAYDGLPTVVLPSSSEKPEAPAPKAEPEQGAGMTQRDTSKEEKQRKSFLSDLQFYGTARIGEDQYSIKQASDDTFYLEKTSAGQRSIVASGFPDIETAQKSAGELVQPLSEEVTSTGQQAAPTEVSPQERGASVETIASGGGMSVEEARQFLARKSDTGEPLIFGRLFSEIAGMQQNERPRVLRTPDKLKAAKQIAGDIVKFKIPVAQEVVDTYGITLPEGYVRQGDLYVFAPEAPAAPAPKAEPEQGAGMTQRDTSKPEQMTPEELFEFEKAQAVLVAEENLRKAKKGEEAPYAYGFKSKAALVRAREDELKAAQEYSRKPDIWGVVIDAKNKQVPVAVELVEGLSNDPREGNGVDSPRKQLIDNLLDNGYVRQGDLYVFAPEAPPTQTKPEDEAKSQAQVKETSRTPSVEGQPSQTRPEVQAQEGAAQRSREGEEGVLTLETAAPGVEPGAAAAPAPAKVQPKEPTEPIETPEQIGIANAVVDLARENLGLPPIERPVQDIYGDDQVWSDAEAAMSAEPDRARYLVKSLIDTPRQASTLETAILLRETVARTARLQQASIELVNATPENKEMARQKYDDAVMSLTEVQEASALAGAEQGRAFRARRFLADLNYSLAVMTTTLQGAHQRKLTDAEVAEVMAESEKINKALKEVNDLKDSAGAVAEEESIFAEAVKEAQAEARLNAKETIRTAKSEIKAGKSVRDVINEKRDAARARLRKRGGSLNVGLNPADLVDYAIIAASYIAEGAVTLKDVTVKMVKEFGAAIEQHMPKIFSEAQVLKSELDNVTVEEPSEAPEKPKGKKPAIEQLREDGEISGRLVYEMVKEKVKSGLTTLDEVFKAITADVQTVVPEITERELRDLFSGYGKVKFPSQEELPKKVRELRRLAQLASAIEDAKNKIAPLRSGPQRDEATLAVREAQKELKRIMKEQGIERAPGPRALKSALDAAKTRLRNQIEELEKQVKERKRAPADKRDIVYDQETKDLIAKRDALQATLEEIDPPQPPTAQELIKKALKDLDKTIAELEKKVKERDISKPATTETPITAQIQVKRDQRDALRKQLKDIRIEIEGEPYLTQEQVNERAERNLSRQIDELQRQIDEKDFEQAKGQKPENTSAIIRLKARRDTLREQRDILKEQTLGKKVKSEAKRIDIAVKALEKSIDSLNERIRKGDVMPLKKPDLVGHNERVKSLREQREGLRKTVREMRKAQENAAKDPEAEQLKRDRQYLESQIKNYQKKLASGDFRPRPKKAKEYSDKLADKTLQLQKLKEEWAEKVFIAQLNSRGKAAKAYDFGKQVLHTSRAVLTSFDVSAVFRQGGFIALGNPVRAFRNLKPMFESLASAKAAQRAKDEIENRTNFKLYRQSKLYLADFNQLNLNQQEETFMSRWLNKIPKVLGGGIIRGSQRAYVTFLNRMRADTFDAMLASLQKGPEPTTEEVNAIANYINIATGRGDLGKFQQAGEALNTVFFAPRLVASRFQILGGYPYFKSSGRTKNLVLREYAKFLTGAALVYAIGMALQDDEDEPVELDPRSSDFLKLRYGDTRVDPLGGLIQASVLLSRLATGEKKQLSGKVVPIRDEYRLLNLFRERPRRNKVGYGADNTFDVGANFLRSKFSPSFGAAVDLLTGETVVGEKTTPTEVGYKMVMPITFGEAAETLEAQGMSKGAALTIISLFGMGVQTYD